LGEIVKSAIIKRSVVLAGHKTSVSLENEFWEGLHQIADLKQQSLAKVVEQIDAERRQNNLSSAIRIFVFNHFRGRSGSRR
jgi:predicted DNA-binding ribbon-helix-helix protein